jgi:hypothetical protein
MVELLAARQLRWCMALRHLREPLAHLAQITQLSPLGQQRLSLLSLMARLSQCWLLEVELAPLELRVVELAVQQEPLVRQAPQLDSAAAVAGALSQRFRLAAYSHYPLAGLAALAAVAVEAAVLHEWVVPQRLPPTPLLPPLATAALVLPIAVAVAAGAGLLRHLLLAVVLVRQTTIQPQQSPSRAAQVGRVPQASSPSCGLPNALRLP